MNHQTRNIDRPIQYISYESDSPQMGRTTQHGEVSLVLCLLALMATPLLVLFPVVGFIPALLGLGGVVAAWIGLKRAPHRRALAMTGLIASTVVFALAASIATIWHATVIVPAISDYEDLGAAIVEARDSLFA